MKKMIALLMAVAMLLSLAACGGDPEPTPTPTPPVNSEVPETTETPEPSAEPETNEVAVGDAIELDFVSIKLEGMGTGAKLTEGNSSYVPSNEKNHFFWLKTTVQNLNGEAFSIWNSGVNFVFDDKYNYEGEVTCFTGYDMDPLVENTVYFRVEIPTTLVESFETVTVQLAFNDNFAEYDYEANDYEETITGYSNLYTLTADRASVTVS